MATGNPAGTVTHLADVLAPERWAAMVQAEFTGKLIMSMFAQEDDSLAGVPGDTVNFPEWNPMALPAQELDEDTEIDVEKITASSTSATIQEVGKGTAVTDRAVLTSFGDPLGESTRQIAEILRRKVDADLNAVLFHESADPALRTGLATGATDPLSVGDNAAASGVALDLDLIFDGIVLFGDDVEAEDIRAFVVNTTDYRKLMSLPEFLTMDKVGNLATVLRGMVGTVAGIPVVRVDRGMTEGKNALVVGNPLQVLYKRRPITEYERKPSWRRTNVYTSTHYGIRRPNAAETVALVKHDPNL